MSCIARFLFARSPLNYNLALPLADSAPSSKLVSLPALNNAFELVSLSLFCKQHQTLFHTLTFFTNMHLTTLLLCGLATLAGARDHRKIDKRSVSSGCVLTYDENCWTGANLGNAVMRFTVSLLTFTLCQC